MRTTPCWLLAGLLVACGSEAAPLPAPRVESAPAPSTDIASPANGSDVERAADQVADLSQAGTTPASTAADRETLAAAARIVQEAAADPVQQAKAPAALRALGAAALPALTASLRAANVTERRIAALTLLQWSDDLHRDGGADDVVAALAAAREDADPAVRAAAEHAYRRATGDTSALDESRAADEAAQRRDH
ncbi:MAG: hypothetical protein R3F29_02010 [Planctomycetota bacterium]